MKIKHTWNPEDYNNHSSIQKKGASQLLKKIKLRGDEAILDVGCGDGKIAAEISLLVPSV